MEHGVVEGIELGHGYAVRVRARNAAGPGHWSIESDQVVCRYKSLAPKVKLNCPKELALKETDTLTVEGHQVVHWRARAGGQREEWNHHRQQEAAQEHPSDRLPVEEGPRPAFLRRFQHERKCQGKDEPCGLQQARTPRGPAHCV